MRMGIAAVLVCATGMAVFAAPEEKGPFDGWTESQISAHRNRSTSKILARLSRWLTARQGLVFVCQRCQGRGRVVVHDVGVGGTSRLVGCHGCGGTGGCVSRAKFQTVFWDYRSPPFRGSPDRLHALEIFFENARTRPDPSAVGMIDGWKRKKVEVRGNHAVALFAEKHGRAWVDRFLVWIEIENEWWIGSPEADADFPAAEYPELPAGPSPPPAPVDPKAPAAPPAPGVDPSTFLDVGPAKVVRVEEDVHKVIGRVINRDGTRRVTDVVIAVTFTSAGEVVETANCPAQSMFLRPGETATYEGYVYASSLRYDCAEVRVLQAKLLDDPVAASEPTEAPPAPSPIPSAEPTARCPACRGSGWLPTSFEKMLGGKMDACPFCEGAGTLKQGVVRRTTEDLVQQARTGAMPGGSGPVWVVGRVRTARRSGNEMGEVELAVPGGRGCVVCLVSLHRGIADRIERLVPGETVEVMAAGIDPARSSLPEGRVVLGGAYVLGR